MNNYHARLRLAVLCIEVARTAKIPFSRVSINRGKYVHYSTFDGTIERYGSWVG